MCGIAGIYAYHYAANPVDPGELRTIRDHMAARGPDGFGQWYSPDQRVGFGHRRLSIIDLSERGAQPMASTDGNLIITFNGEIYNYRELRLPWKQRAAGFARKVIPRFCLSFTPKKAKPWSMICAACLRSGSGMQTSAHCCWHGIPMALSRFTMLTMDGRSALHHR